jgi:membrane protein YqaA with SNARE-associated domain
LNRESRLDQFVSARGAEYVACAWGFAEATAFFLVPDVFLTLMACRRLRAALRATVASLLGALLGGTLMYAFGLQWPDTARFFLGHIPGISAGLIDSVEIQVRDHGLTALMLGPLRGTPYKIYAVDWGARGGNFLFFMLASVPARYIRFLVTALLANAVTLLLTPWTKRNVRTEMTIWALFWVAFYSLYFARFGW